MSGHCTDDGTTLSTLSFSTNLTDGGYDYELLGGTDSRYECPICLLYLRDPVLTTCGHRFCSGCISQWIIKEGGVCPVCHVAISHENIFPDNYTRREILQCKARCPFVKEGCAIVLSLCDLEKHIQTDHSDVSGNSSLKLNESPSSANGLSECLYKEVGCVTYFPHDQLQRHLEMDVHHHLQLLTAAYKRLKVFSSIRTNGEHSSPSELLLRQDSRDSSRWLLADEIDSDEYQFRRQRSWDSVRFARKHNCRHHRYPERLAESDESICKGSEADSQCKAKEVLSKVQGCSESNGSSPQLQDIFERLVRLEQNDREKQIKIESLESQLASAVNLFSSSARLMNDITARYSAGVFVWKITGFNVTCQEMRTNPNKFLHSPGFYTESFGYKLCLRFNLTTPSSRGAAAGIPIDLPLERDTECFAGLYVHFMQGEFDNTIRWPFQGEMKLTIIHPRVPENSLTEIIHTKPDGAAFAKPNLPRNPTGIGYPEFCVISKLFSSGFVKNDTLICKVLARAY